MPKLRNGSKGGIRTRARSIASTAFYSLATELHRTFPFNLAEFVMFGQVK